MDNVADEPAFEPDPAGYYWDVLSWHWGMFSEGSGKVGVGATVPIQFVQRQSRAWFLGALYRLAPHVSQELLRHETFAKLDCLSSSIAAWESALDTEGQFVARHMEEIPEQALEQITRHPLYGPVSEASAALDGAIQAWQSRHNLSARWIYTAAQETIQAAKITFDYPDPSPKLTDNLPNGLPLMLDFVDRAANPHIDKQDYAMEHGIRPGAMKWGPIHKQVHIEVYLDDLKHPPILMHDEAGEPYGELEDDGVIGSFDPRTEDVKHATERLLEALRPRIRARLEAVEIEDRELNGALSPVRFRSPDAFEWLVRYQILGESRGAISRATGADKSQVSRAIKDAATFIGLTLRKEKPGRPKKNG